MDKVQHPKINLKGDCRMAYLQYENASDVACHGRASGSEHLYNLKSCFVWLLRRNPDAIPEGLGAREILWKDEDGFLNCSEHAFMSACHMIEFFESFLLELGNRERGETLDGYRFGKYFGCLIHGEHREDGSLVVSCFMTSLSIYKDGDTVEKYLVQNDKLRSFWRYLQIHGKMQAMGLGCGIGIEEVLFECILPRRPLWEIKDQPRGFMMEYFLSMLESIDSDNIHVPRRKHPPYVYVTWRRWTGYPSLSAIFADNLVVFAATSRQLPTARTLVRHFLGDVEPNPNTPEAFTSWLYEHIRVRSDECEEAMSYQVGSIEKWGSRADTLLWYRSLKNHA